MGVNVSTAVADVVEEQQSNVKPKRLPPYAVIILNDDLHSFDYVVDALLKVFKYPLIKCQMLTLTIHTAGRAVVWSGSKEVAELKKEQIISVGTDFTTVQHGKNPVTFPLGVVLEPLPQ